MKIVHILSGLDRGGAQHAVAQVASTMAEDHDVEIWLKCHKERAFHIDQRVVVREMCRSGCLGALRFALRTRRMIRLYRPDIVIGHTNRNTVPVLLAARTVGVPPYAAEHSVAAGLRSRPWRLARRVFYPLATRVIVLSTDQVGRYPGARVTVIPNPLDAGYDGATAQTFSANDKRAPAIDQLRVLFVGRLEHVKGADRLVRAARDFQIPYHLDVVGSGSQERFLRLLVAKLRLVDNVTFHGWQRDLHPFYQTAHVLAVPSRLEGFGLTAIEAMAHGCVPVAYDVEGGLSDIITHGRDGFLVRDGDEGAFCAALRKLARDPDNLQRCAVAATKSVRRYAPQSVVQHWYRLIERDVA